MLFTSLLRIWLTRSLKPFAFNGDHLDLDYQEVENLGLYVHIPFCRNLCSFCPYCKVAYESSLAALYKKALLQEISLVSHGKERRSATSLYFGGGTPALMIDDLKDIIVQIRHHFGIQNGIGVELHPEDVSEENLLKLKAAGVTMISIGMQSFNKGCLERLGRKEPDFLRISHAIKRVSFDVVDMDLIFGIPGQNADILQDDIKSAFENGATQISTYPFIDFTFANKDYKPLPEKEKKKMLSSIDGFAEELGCERTSIWTFARPGTSKYSSITRDNFLGFGVSATTLLKDQFKINTFSIDAYVERLKQDKLPTSLTLKFTPRQRMTYYLFWSAYGMRIDSTSFERFFGEKLAGKYGFELFLGKMLGYLKRRGNIYLLTRRGAYRFHCIEQAYTTSYIDKMWNISGNFAFPERIELK